MVLLVASLVACTPASQRPMEEDSAALVGPTLGQIGRWLEEDVLCALGEGCADAPSSYVHEDGTLSGEVHTALGGITRGDVEGRWLEGVWAQTEHGWDWHAAMGLRLDTEDVVYANGTYTCIGEVLATSTSTYAGYGEHDPMDAVVSVRGMVSCTGDVVGKARFEVDACQWAWDNGGCFEHGWAYSGDVGEQPISDVSEICDWWPDDVEQDYPHTCQ